MCAERRCELGKGKNGYRCLAKSRLLRYPEGGAPYVALVKDRITAQEVLQMAILHRKLRGDA